MDTRGSYTCECKPGFEGDGYYNCSGENATDSTGIIKHASKAQINTRIDHLQTNTHIKKCFASSEVRRVDIPTFQYSIISIRSGQTAVH